MHLKRKRELISKESESLSGQDFNAVLVQGAKMLKYKTTWEIQL